MVEHLPSNYEALSSTHSIEKKESLWVNCSIKVWWGDIISFSWSSSRIYFYFHSQNEGMETQRGEILNKHVINCTKGYYCVIFIYAYNVLWSYYTPFTLSYYCISNCFSQQFDLQLKAVALSDHKDHLHHIMTCLHPSYHKTFSSLR
jgi:hypothetical protein